MSSGTLRGCRTGPGHWSGRRSPAPSATASASRIVSGETWDRSTSMPIRCISRTTARPNVGQPAGLRLVRGGVGPADVGVVGERQVADAERVERAQHPHRGRRCYARPRRRAARRSGPRRRSAARRRRSARAPGRRGSAGPAAAPGRSAPGWWPRPPGRPAIAARTPTRTGRRPRPRAAAAGRCAVKPTGWSGRPSEAAAPASRSAQGRSLCPSSSGTSLSSCAARCSAEASLIFCPPPASLIRCLRYAMDRTAAPWTRSAARSVSARSAGRSGTGWW